ncbi:MAG: tetratricopeptide repeat protein [Phycisphaerales bacterium]
MTPSLAATTARRTRAAHVGGEFTITLAASLAGVALVSLTGCTNTGGYSTSPYTDMGGVPRDTAASERLALRAADVIEADPPAAEKLLREALALDLYNGPAHNNLGTLLLTRGDLYEAASEFEWAKKLLPGHPDPRVNLALTLERAGRTDEALATYDAALEVYPNHLGATQGLVRLQLRSGRADDRTLAMLQEVAMRGESDQWRSWAAAQVALRGR